MPDVWADLRQINKECKFVTERIEKVKADNMRLAIEADIFNMELEEILEWFDLNASRLFQSVAYSRIKNSHNYRFGQYVNTRKQLIRERGEMQTSISIVSRNSKLRSSFAVYAGPMLRFGGSTMFDGALTILPVVSHANAYKWHCVQFSNRFTKIVNRFCADIKPEAVMRALRGVKSTAVYRTSSNDIITY